MVSQHDVPCCVCCLRYKISLCIGWHKTDRLGSNLWHFVNVVCFQLFQREIVFRCRMAGLIFLYSDAFGCRLRMVSQYDVSCCLGWYGYAIVSTDCCSILQSGAKALSLCVALQNRYCLRWSPSKRRDLGTDRGLFECLLCKGISIQFMIYAGFGLASEFADFLFYIF